MKVDTKIINIKHLYTPVKPIKSYHVKQLSNCEIAIKDGKIVAIGNALTSYDANYMIDAKGKVALPGFIDGHTHLVHGGSREHEFDLKLNGVAYMDILKQDGGILSTVKATRQASFDSLYQQALKSLNHMLQFGVTTIEAKSGYGLDTDTELKQLKVNQKLNQDHVIDIHSTFLKAHALPIEYKEDKDEYIQSVLDDMDYIKKHDLAKAVDIFCEAFVFDDKDTEKLAKKAKQLNLNLRIHTDEIESIGGTPIALNYNAKSIDHLIVISDDNIQKAAHTNTLCNLLPSTSFYLNKPYARARKMIDKGCMIGISSDYNPGSTPSENLQFSMHLAALKMRLTPEEILTGVTLHPAYSLEIDHQVGILDTDYDADIVLCDIPNLAYFFYHYGINHVTDVFKKGQHVVKNRLINSGGKSCH
ncbi:MAG: imidazolonepropionase [Candidatus Izemoplasma sp.]|nr:imidazolonepropionase [Candidatus Izemoplasma sp.]